MSALQKRSLSHSDEEYAYWYLHLSAESQHAYEVFRKSLEDANALVAGADDRWTLLRFLKARQYDPVKAKTMYLNMAKWRVENDIEKLYETFTFPELDAVIPYYTHFYHKV